MRVYLCGLLFIFMVQNASAQMRFLTSNQLPGASTIKPFHFQFVVANATAAVTFTSPDLPAGFVLVPETGELRATIPFPSPSNLSFTVVADDGINAPVTSVFALAVDVIDPGLNGSFVALNATEMPAAFLNQPIPPIPLTTTGGVGPFVFAAHGLPLGVTLDANNTITGIPTQSGVFRITTTVVDLGQGNARDTQVSTLTVLPPSNFQFTNGVLTSGELGTPFFGSMLTANGLSSVTFSAINLPPGLIIDPNTGIIEGTPLTAGAFFINLSAQSGTDTITETQVIHIAPSTTSNLIFSNVVVPPALVQTQFGSLDTPVLISPITSAEATTTATGLPTGLAYVSSLTGIPTSVGVFSSRFVATSGTDTIIYDAVIPVVRQDGGSTNELGENLFINSMNVANSQTPGKASWKATMRFNSDRSSGNLFNPVTNPLDDFTATISTHRIFAPAASFTKSGDIFKFKSAKGVVPVVSVTIDMSAEKITLSSTKDTFEAPLANQTVPVTVSLGSRFYQLTVALDKNGKLVVTPGYRSVSFIGTSAKADLIDPGHDVLDMNLLLADPNFHFTPNVGGLFPLVIRLFNGPTLISIVNIDQGVFTTTEKDGKIYYKITSASALKKTKFFQYDSKTGKMAMTLSQLFLSSFVDVDEPLGVEVDIDNQIYFTQVTLFRWNVHTYKYAFP